MSPRSGVLPSPGEVRYQRAPGHEPLARSADMICLALNRPCFRFLGLGILQPSGGMGNARFTCGSP